MSEPVAPASPVAPLAQRVGLALVAATVVARTLTCGAGLELDLPGSQLLLDALALCAAACVAIGRCFEGASVFAAGRAVLGATLLSLVVLGLSAARAPHAELAWRTAITDGSLLLLALAVRDLARDPRRARGLLAVGVGCVLAGAALAVWQELVEQPLLLAQVEAGEVALPDHPGFRQQMLERLHARGSAGPFLLANLLACAVGMALPALVVVGLQARRQVALALPLGAGAALLLGALVQARSKGGALAVLAGLAALALLHPRLDAHRRRLAIGGAIAGGVVLAGGLAWWAVHPEAEGVGLSLQVRLEYWRAGLGMFASSPLLGVGVNQFRCFYPAFKSLRAEEVAHAHNGAVEVASDAGLLGLLALAALAAAWLRPAIVAATRGRDEAPAAKGEGRADDLTLLGGVLLGVLLAGAYGDAYPVAEKPLELLGALATILAALGVAARCPAPPPRALAAAAVAGLTAFAVDGLTDFGLAFANTVLLAALLAGLGPGLGHAPVGESDGLRGRGGVALAAALSLAAVLALGVALLVGHPADAARREGRDAHEAAAAAKDRGEQRARLEAALEGFQAASAAWPWHARTWLERAAVEQSLGRRAEARASLERALALEPRSAQTRRELAELLEAEGDLRGARTALDEAVALYPGEPHHLLAAARLRLRGTPTPADRSEALALLRRSLEASATIRQVSVRLSDEERAEAERLVATLGR